MIDEKELQVTEGFLKSVEDLLDNRGAIVTPWIRALIAEVRRLREENERLLGGREWPDTSYHFADAT